MPSHDHERIQIDFYTRQGCHLCEDALRILEKLRSEFAFEIRVVDISRSEELSQLYGDEIPVATLNGRKILKYHADEKALRRILSRRRSRRFR